MKPRISPSAEKGISIPTTVIWKALTTQTASAGVSPSEPAAEGSAMFTMLASSTAMAMPAEMQTEE